MVGTVVENLSNRKLLYILASLLVTQIAFFLVGAWYAPVPSSSMEYEMIKCKDGTKGESGKWFHIRPRHCDVIGDLSSYTPTSFDLREIVFVAQMPHMSSNIRHGSVFHAWSFFKLKVEDSDIFKYVDGALLELEIRMGYRTNTDAADEWHDLITTNITRTLECSISPEKKSNGHMYDCGVIDLFEMGSNNYPFYLLNVRIPINQTACAANPKSPNCQIGKVTNLRVVTIHQNGGFTQIWLWLKTLVFPVVAAAIWWYWNRIEKLARKPILLEKAIMTLGVSLAVLDFPLEWVSLILRVPFMLLLGDIRQGAFYGVLFAFWLIFAGEHLIDDSSRNNILPPFSLIMSKVERKITTHFVILLEHLDLCQIDICASYRFNLFFIVVASSLLLIYDICERGFQLSDPFYSIWSSEIGSIIAVESIIYRFKFLMVLTLLCAGLTISCYIMKQYGEAQIHSDEPEESVLAHSTSAFFTGTFGMWNIYVLLLLAMYAPSHKCYSGMTELVDENEDLMDGTYEANPMTTFLKPATD
ncbi:hypothetical protein OSTOST_17989, partial [Ostertagia ostertagi]